MSLENGRETKIGVSVVGAKEIESLSELARSSSKKRAMRTLYRTQGEMPHEVVNKILPESYIRPHKHLHPSQIETFVPLAGIAELLTFTEDGRIDQRILLTHGMVVKVEVNTWHTLVALTPFAAFEVKVHPAGDDKGKGEVFAPWAPEEGTKEADIYFENFRQKLGLSEAS